MSVSHKMDKQKQMDNLLLEGNGSCRRAHEHTAVWKKI